MAKSTRIRLAAKAIARARQASPTHGAVAEVFYADTSGDTPPVTSRQIAAELDLDCFTAKRVLREVRMIGQEVLYQYGVSE